MKKKLKVIVIGAGGRGIGYTDIMADSEGFEVVGVAEPIDDRREYVKNKHGISDENCFDTWEKILDKPKFADVAIISTMDRMHYAPAMKAIELGYNLLLEKPVAPTAQECVDILKQAEKYNVKVVVCHVLRYTDFFRGLKNVIKSGAIGDVVSVIHVENVGNIHQSHSFVRGNWGNKDEASFMLLQKSCHDLDILQWLLEKDCKKIQSFGALRYFKSENAPKDAPDYCIEGCPEADKCYYNAVKLYLDDKENGWFRSAATKKTNPTDDDVIDALKNTQYGKCVFKCNNNVVDHQIVNMEFDDDTTVSFTMCAFNRGGRQITVMGTDGFLTAEMDGEKCHLYRFSNNETEEIDLSEVKHGETIVDGHGGGDSGIIEDLYKYINGECDASEISEIGISCKNHMLVFAAEESRLDSKVVDIHEFLKRYDLK